MISKFFAPSSLPIAYCRTQL